jgi:hypothetical protein
MGVYLSAHGAGQLLPSESLPGSRAALNDLDGDYRNDALGIRCLDAQAPEPLSNEVLAPRAYEAIITALTRRAEEAERRYDVLNESHDQMGRDLFTANAEVRRLWGEVGRLMTERDKMNDRSDDIATENVRGWREVQRLRYIISSIEALHRFQPRTGAWRPESCSECGDGWPCRTVAALHPPVGEGEQ